MLAIILWKVVTASDTSEVRTIGKIVDWLKKGGWDVRVVFVVRDFKSSDKRVIERFRAKVKAMRVLDDVLVDEFADREGERLRLLVEEIERPFQWDRYFPVVITNDRRLGMFYNRVYYRIYVELGARAENGFYGIDPASHVPAIPFFDEIWVLGGHEGKVLERLVSGFFAPRIVEEFRRKVRVVGRLLVDRFDLEYEGNKERLVMYGGRFSEQKGISRIVRISKMLAADGEKVVLTNPFERGMERELAEAESIEVVRKCNRSCYYGWLRKAKVFLTASPNEGLPIGFVEALRYGAVIVAPDTDWARWMFGDKYKFLYRSDEEAFALVKRALGMNEDERLEVVSEVLWRLEKELMRIDAKELFDRAYMRLFVGWGKDEKELEKRFMTEYWKSVGKLDEKTWKDFVLISSKGKSKRGVGNYLLPTPAQVVMWMAKKGYNVRIDGEVVRWS